MFTDDNQAYRLTLGINMLNNVSTLVDGLESDDLQLAQWLQMKLKQV